MTDNPYADEPPINSEIASCIADYWNEPWSHLSFLERAVEAVGCKCDDYYTNADDNAFRKAIKAAQLEYRVRTIAERFANPNSRQAMLSEGAKPFWEWVAASPKRVARIDELAGILNTTDDPAIYKRAFNEIGDLIYAKPRTPTFQISSDPRDALRTTLGDSPSQGVELAKNAP